jgi:bromodomain-containing factor 1
MDSQGDSIAEAPLDHKEEMDVDVSDQPAGELLAGEQPATAPAPAPEASAEDSTAAAPETTEHDGDGDGGRDHEMVDIPESSGKNVRAREDDDDMEEPATKKTRTGDDGSPASEFKVPDVPSAEAASQTNGRVSTNSAGRTMTKAQHKYLLVGLRNLKRIKDAAAFLEPVDPVKLNIPTYPNIIKNPMDVGTMERKLKAEEYATVEEYIADMDLIVNNAMTFNGPDHFVSGHAMNMKKAFEKQLGHLPKADVVEPSTAEKKAKKWAAGNASAAKATPVRRPSRTASGQASSPTGGSAPSSFALGPNGVPTIRRDSTAGDGRPKREIHPPPSRDLPYSGAKPRKKKFLAELKFCDDVIKELFKPKYSSYAHVFYEPVDPVALNIPQYHKIIKKPMDLGTISSKLKANQYENASEFEADVRQIFTNCYKFNPPKDAVHQFGKQLEQLFNEKWSEKKAYLERHAGVSGSRSPASSVEPEEEASEEEDGEDVERVIHEKIREITQQVEALKKMKTKGKGGKGGAVASGSSLPAGKKANKKTGASTAAVPLAKNKKKLAKSKEPKAPYVTYEQKQEISDKINTLATSKMNQAYKIIRDNMPQLTVSVHKTIT